MKKNLAIIVVLLVFISMFIGCSSAPISTNDVRVAETPKPVPSGTPIVEAPLDKAAADAVKGIPECDEVLVMLATETNRKVGNEAANLNKTAFLNKVKEAVKQSVNNNKGDKAETAKNCKSLKAQFARYKKMNE